MDVVVLRKDKPFIGKVKITIGFKTYGSSYWIKGEGESFSEAKKDLLRNIRNPPIVGVFSSDIDMKEVRKLIKKISR
jgi:hypothetical protein